MRDAGRTSWWRGVGAFALFSSVLAFVGCTAAPGSNTGEPTANRAPVPRITDAAGNIDPTSITISACQNLTLNASTSADEDNDALTYSWVFEDGATPITTAEASYEYVEAGTYDVTLTVSDGRGLDTSTATRTLSVTVNESLVPAFTYTPITGQAPLAVTFDSSTSSDCDGTIASYSWDFNEDSQEDANVANPTFTFTDGGVFTVRLTITDNEGNTAFDENDITIGEPDPVAPTVTATASLATADVGEVITFTATGADPDGDPKTLTYAWDFGDSVTGTGEVVTHSYAAIDDYTASVTVTDAQGLTATATLEPIEVIISNLPPVAVINAEPTRGVAPLTVAFDALQSTDPEDEGLFSYCWDLDNGATGICPGGTISGDPDDPQSGALEETYEESGDYEVTLYVTDVAFSASATVTETIEVREVTAFAAVDDAEADVTNLILMPDETYELKVIADLDSAFSGETAATWDITADEKTTYASDNTAAATVDADGVITAEGEGTATITITWNNATTPAPYVVTVTVGTPLSAVVASANPTVVAPDATVTLTAIPTDGIEPLTYAWSIVEAPELSVATITNANMAVATFVPDEEGQYIFKCTVTDSASTPVPVPSNDVTVNVTTMTAAFLRTDDQPDDTCAVAPMPLEGDPPLPPTPNGADGPAENVSVTLDSDLTLDVSITTAGGGTDFTYEWSTTPIIGTLTSVENVATWTYPTVAIDARTEVFISVMVTDNDTGAVATFTYDADPTNETPTVIDPFIVVPAPLLTDICIEGELTPCSSETPLDTIVTGGEDTSVFVTIHLDPDTGNFLDSIQEWTTQYQITEDSESPDVNVVACTTAQEFEADPFATCEIEFLGTADGEFSFRVRMRETCNGDITGTGSLVPRFDNHFTLDVSP